LRLAVEFKPGGRARRRQRAGPPLAQSSTPGKEDLEQGRGDQEKVSLREKGKFFFFEKRNRGEDMNLRAEALSGRAACE